MQGFCLKVGSVLLGTEGHCSQGVIHAYRLRHAVSAHHECCLSHVVQAQRIYRYAVLHAVMHGSHTASYAYIVNLLCRIVIVIYIALSHLHLYVVLTLQAEHWVIEGVESLSLILRIHICQRHLHLFTLEVGGVIVLVA